MTQVPNFFRKGGGPNVLFSFQNFGTGRGIVPLYFGDYEDGYLLSDSPYFSELGYITDSGGDVVISNDAVDADFDIQFQRAVTIGGYMLVNIPFGFHSINAGSTHTRTFTITARKYSNSVETDLASTSDQVINENVPVNEWIMKVKAFLLNVPLTTFGKDDIFRITIASSAQGGANPSNRQTYVFIDPANNGIISIGSAGTQPNYPPPFFNSTAYVPVKVEV